ncbi:MAG: hypothetical protein U5R31_17475 [Acidimicrobiia bacterium]|nr:hypothetical protein [Acidimicrobiia bacterium]
MKVRRRHRDAGGPVAVWDGDGWPAAAWTSLRFVAGGEHRRPRRPARRHRRRRPCRDDGPSGSDLPPPGQTYRVCGLDLDGRVAMVEHNDGNEYTQPAARPPSRSSAPTPPDRSAHSSSGSRAAGAVPGDRLPPLRRRPRAGSSAPRSSGYHPPSWSPGASGTRSTRVLAARAAGSPRVRPAGTLHAVEHAGDRPAAPVHDL